MDYPCGKFGGCISAVLALSCWQTETQTTDADDRYTPATIGVDN